MKTLPRIRPDITSPLSVSAPFHTTSPLNLRLGKPDAAPGLEPVPRKPPKTPPETDFGEMDILGSVPTPATAVALCRDDGFVLESGTRIDGGDGALLIAGEAFRWRPWSAGLGDQGLGDGRSGIPAAAARRRRLVNDKGQLNMPEEAWAMFGVLWPRPGV